MDKEKTKRARIETLDDLIREALKLCDGAIVSESDGEIIINTGRRENKDGRIVCPGSKDCGESEAQCCDACY